MSVRIIQGDCCDALKTLPNESVHCIVTSPPYFGLRDYGTEPTDWAETELTLMPGFPAMKIPAMRCCHGLEPDPYSFIAHEVGIFRECRRVLRNDGTLWLNIGDSYANDGKWGGSTGGKHAGALHGETGIGRRKLNTGLKPKDLIGIPWMLAFALRADGWYLRQDIIWRKPNPMPESMRDRCTKAHEYLFLLSKSERYYFDQDAIAEAAITGAEYVYAGEGNGLHSGESHAGSGQSTRRFKKGVAGWATGAGNDHSARAHSQGDRTETHAALVKASASKRNSFARESKDSAGEHGQKPQHRADRENVSYGLTRNKRSVWDVPTKPFAEAHFATFPPALIEPCILAGCPKGGTALDPFGGACTTGLVADRLQRSAIVIELNPNYVGMGERRIRRDAPLFAEVSR